MQKIVITNAQTITVAGGKDYNDLDNKPSINSVELEGNKTLHELGIQQEGNYLTEIPSDYKTKSQNDELYQAKGSYATTSDLATKQDVITSENKLSSDLVSGLSNVATSGDYEDLSNKPTVPTKTSDLTNDSDFITKDVNNLTYYELKTATGNSIAMSIDSSTYVLTVSLKNSAGTILNTQTVDLPLETMVVGGSYDSTNKKIILTLKNGETVEFSVADLVSGLQSEITSSNKLSADLVDDTNTTNKFVSASDKTTWNGKYDKPIAGIPSTDLSSAVQTSLGKADTALQSETYTGTITSVKMNGSTVASSGEADLGTVITSHQDISGKLDTSNVKTTTSTTQGEVYDVTYINSLVGDINTVLATLTTPSNNGGGE